VYYLRCKEGKNENAEEGKGGDGEKGMGHKWNSLLTQARHFFY
jgi:hypothetical protein